MRTTQIIDDIFLVFRKRGYKKLYGEAVTELQHALQCATIAERAGEAPHIIAACLFHDYGHLCHELGEDIADRGVVALHENIGANKLLKFSDPEVVEPVRLHVVAKRYLCWSEPDYLDGLTDAVRGLDEAITNSPSCYTLQLAAVDYDRKRGAFDSALARVDVFVNQYPVKEPWLALRAEVLEQAGRTKVATETFQRVIAGIEKNPTIRRGLDLTQKLEQRARQGLARIQANAHIVSKS